MHFKPFVATSLLLIIATTFLWYQPIKINLSGSMPVGLYWRLPMTTIYRGDWVSVCLPRNIAKEGLQRGYLSYGLCDSGAIPVLKMVIAVPGDQVVVSANRIMVNGKSYPAPRQNYDSHGHRVLQCIKNGQYEATGYWLHGVTNITESWDSRYYGPVNRSQIRGRYHLWWSIRGLNRGYTE